MASRDDVVAELTNALGSFGTELKRWQDNHRRSQRPEALLRACARLQETVRRLLPLLAQLIGEGLAPAFFAEQVVDYAVVGMNVRARLLLWTRFFKGGITLACVGKESWCSLSEIKRKKKHFFKDVAEHLYEKNAELEQPVTAQARPQTLESIVSDWIEDAFQLPPRTAQIVSFLCRQRILDDIDGLVAQLNITVNTLKDHKPAVCQATNATDFPNAIAIVRRRLQAELQIVWAPDEDRAALENDGATEP